MIHYRIKWKPKGVFPGAVSGQSAGIGDKLRALVLLRDHPDPRRLDLHSSLRDPFERFWVKDFYLNTSIQVIVLLDHSASMAYQGEVSRPVQVNAFLSDLALSVYKSGDALGIYVANTSWLQSLFLPIRRNRSAWNWVNERLSRVPPSGNSCEGLIQCANLLPKKRALVFLVSDFRWPKGQLRRLLKRLQHHDVVPLMLSDAAESISAPQSGLASVYDMETGSKKFVWMRPSIIQQLATFHQQHIQDVTHAVNEFGFQLHHQSGKFNPEKLTAYFMQRSYVS